MKIIKILLLNIFIMGLCLGCSKTTPMIKSYTDTALENKRLIIKMNQEDHHDFFAEDLVVFPKAAINVEETVVEETTVKESEIIENADELMDDDEPSNTAASGDEAISSDSVLLAGVDSMQDIYGKNVYDRVYPASITKIMTALITLQKANFSDVVVFSEEMEVYEYGAKLCGFDVGDQLTVDQLFKGLLIYSGNDAANALAVYLGGSIEGFSDMMNSEARRLGCVDTHFMNPSGLHDNDHYTSAYDLYLIFNECLKYEPFKEVIRQNSCEIKYTNIDGDPVEATYKTTNQYFTDDYDYPENIRVLGGKTGTTDQAGCCLILYDIDEQNQGYISLVLGANDYDILYSEMNTLLNKITK